jgi:hypothetical protein
MALRLKPLLPGRASPGCEHGETCWWRWSRALPCWTCRSRTPPPRPLVWHFAQHVLPQMELQQRDEMLRIAAHTTNWLQMGTLWCPFRSRPMATLGSQLVACVGMLCAEAVAAGDVSKSGFVAAAIWELSVGLRKALQGQLSDASGIRWCVGLGCWPGLPSRSGSAC